LIRVKGHEIALFNLEGSYYAITNICPHSTGPLVEGRVSGTMVTCPWHGAQFDITSGQCLGGPATRDIVVYEVRVEGNDIYLTIS
jgi:nitrite reductase (NADH) small subunit/3-phenylpropionate/trans-cinnamate dioxygenase ferredoxin subunit